MVPVEAIGHGLWKAQCTLVSYSCQQCFHRRLLCLEQPAQVFLPPVSDHFCSTVMKSPAGDGESNGKSSSLAPPCMSSPLAIQWGASVDTPCYGFKAF
jgi:hypothetical protein